MPKFVLYLITICYLLFLALTPPAHAQTMNSSNYQIRMGNFNITSGYKSSSSYSLTDTVGQTAASYFSGTGYHVKAGFQYIYTLYNFSFSISSTAITLPTTPNTFSTDSHTLTVTAPGQGYSVTAYMVQPLTNQHGDTIPDTPCDSGPCTETNATAWTTPTNNGFGYNMTGNDIPTDFTNSTFFRPFPNAAASEAPATVMTSAQAGKNRLATVTYQLSPSGSQASGTYTTQIIYIATPVY